MSQPDFLRDVLRKLGWDDGFQIPVANEENKALEAEVARLTLRRIEAKAECDNVTEKCESMERHLKFLAQESDEIQKLLTTQKRQLDAENDNLRTATAEKNRLIQDMRDTAKKLSELQDKNQKKRDEVKKNMEKIEKIKQRTVWDQEALKAWEEFLQKRTEDNSLLQKFSKEDEKKFLELEAKRAGLQMEYLQRQKTVEKMLHDLTNYESILERTGKTIKTQMAERDSLVLQWKETLNILHQRDNAISNLQDKLVEKVEKLQKYEEVKKNEERLQSIEKRNNKELEKENEEYSAEYSRSQKELEKLLQYVSQLTNEETLTRRQLTKAATQLENERCKYKMLSNEILDKREEIDKTELKIELLKEKYAVLEKSNVNVAEKCKQLEKVIEFESGNHSVLLADSERITHELYKIQVKLNDQMKTSENRELEITNTATIIEGLQRRIKEVRAQVEEKKETLYTAEFKIDQIEEKLALLEKQKHADDDEEVGLRIKELEEEHARQTETKNILRDQMVQIQREMRRLTTTIANDESNLKLLEDKLQNEKLEFEGGQKQVVLIKSKAQENQVEENLLHLKLRQFNQNMKKEDDEIYNLEKMKLNLEQAMMERDLEIKGKKDLLLVQKRNLNEDSGRLRTDIKARETKINQLQARYHLVNLSLGTDSDGQTLSMTHYKLKSAQEKFFVIQQGDQLDEKIRTIESEIVAMENTLKVVNLSNAAFKKSLGEVKDEDDEAKKLEKLQTRHAELTEELKNSKKNLEDVKKELEDLTRQSESLKQEKKDLQGSLLELKNELDKLEKQVEAKEEKLNRTTTMIKRLSKKLDQELTIKYDRDQEIKQMEEANNKSLQKLRQLGKNHIEIEPALNLLAEDYQVTLPNPQLISSKSSISSSKLSTTSSSTTLNLSSTREGSCSCTTSSSASISNVVLTFDGK